MADQTDGAGAEKLRVTEPEPSRVRRRALWGALAVLAVAAGGLAVAATGDEGPARLPVALGGPGAEQASAPASDMAMVAWIRYVAGDDLPLLGGNGPAYRLQGAVSSGEVDRLAQELGLSGQAEHDDGLWRLATPDGTLEVYEGGGGLWWYSSEDLSSRDDDGSVSSAGGGASGSEGCDDDATDCSPTTLAPPSAELGEANCGADDICTEPEEPFVPPADLPTRAEAEARARDLFTSLGAPIDDAVVTVEGPYDAWFVMIEPRVDGLTASGLSYTASIGSEGKLLSAGGVINQVGKVGDYPTLDTRGAIDRLNDGSGLGGAPGPGVDTAVADPAESDSTTTVVAEERIGPDGVPVETEPDHGCAAEDRLASQDTVAGDPEPMPIITPCDEPPSEPVEIVLRRAQRILTVVSANDESGDTYLVPGYRFRGDDDAVVEVASVDDGSLLPAPEPADEPGSGDTVAPDEPATRCAPPVPGPDGSEPDICREPDTVDPAAPSTTTPEVGRGTAGP